MRLQGGWGMKRLVGLIVVATLLVTLAAVVAGCGTTSETKGGTGIIVPSGKVSIKKSGDSITITKGGKTTTWTAQTSSEKALGFPVPSSATVVKGTAIEVSKSSEKWLAASFYTNDDVNLVIDYYKSQLSGMDGFSDTSANIGGQMVGLFSVQSGNDTKSVIIRASESGEQGKTWIQIATASNPA
jgi:hypothetical protein